MKKIIALTLSVLMLFAFTACSSAAGENPKSDNAYSLVEDGKLIVALSPDFSPMEFVDTSKSGQEQYVGFDVTLANFLADELGLELVIKPMSFDACQTAVQLGAVDISISGYSWTEDRAENFSLSDYYYAGDNETQQTIVTLSEKAGTFKAPTDFTGMKIAAQAASLQELLCNEQIAEYAKIELFKAIDDAVLALKTGKVDGVAVAYGNGEAIIANNPDISMSGFEFAVEDAATNNVVMLNKNATALTVAVNELLKKAYDAGYYGQWYEDAKMLAGIETAADVSYDDEGNAPQG
ncbi:MAG TPA: transporter substrate-binding domain-containing protein [Clostridia bacterium]|nr:transporter substrate-binding domain-containing protein [Clostridia bacterium]